MLLKKKTTFCRRWIKNKSCALMINTKISSLWADLLLMSFQ